MIEFVVNDRTGEVHAADCPRVRVIASVSPWNPAKAALTPGVRADKICLPAGLPLRQGSPGGEVRTEYGVRDKTAGNIVVQANREWTQRHVVDLNPTRFEMVRRQVTMTPWEVVDD